MKLNRPFRKPDQEDSRLYGKETENTVASWAETDSTKFKKLSKEAKIEGRRAPELWVQDGQSRLIRFLDDDPITSFKVYKFKHNGKWRTFVKPADGQTDLFSSAMGLKPSRVFLWRIIDIDGYTDKKGKRFTNQPRFLMSPTRMFDQIQMMSEETSEQGSLSQYNVKISRSGTATNTSYMFLPKPPTPLTPEMKKGAAQFPKWTDYYRPFSKSQQEAIAMSHGKSVSDDEE